MEWKQNDSSEKKMLQVQWSVKEVTLTVFWYMKEPITIDFLEKGATVDRAAYCQLLRQNSPSYFFFLSFFIIIIIIIIILFEFSQQ